VSTATDERASTGTTEPLGTWINVARMQLVDRITVLAAPCAVLAFALAAALVVIGTLHTIGLVHPSVQAYTGALASFYGVIFNAGVVSIIRYLPFALALGVSRCAYYAGTALLAVALGAVYGLALAVLQAIERATGGWGLSLNFFRVPYLLDGSWYLTWLTSFVVLTLVFVYGMWFGLVYRRWNLVGLWTFGAAQVTVLLAAAVLATGSHAWPAIGRFFTALSAVGLTGLLAGLALVLLAGGFATIRRVTV
jgi:hypothetical protein